LRALESQNRYPLLPKLRYMDRMFPERPRVTLIVLDDRSRLPWRFFGRLTTAALIA
jgi:hypothetical protein